jgi:hypothetical protein
VPHRGLAVKLGPSRVPPFRNIRSGYANCLIWTRTLSSPVDVIMANAREELPVSKIRRPPRGRLSTLWTFFLQSMRSVRSGRD